MIVVTGATGQLGQLVVDELLKRTEAANIIAAVRTPSKASAMAAQGIQVRHADYSRPDTLAAAFQGATRLLLVSGTELGKRTQQHSAAIDAAKQAGVGMVAYTSILHCDTSPLILAKEHLATERYLIGSGLRYAFLRNGWYYENQTATIPAALVNGAFIGASGKGCFAAASRTDFAAAAATVLTNQSAYDRVLELGGDDPYNREELAAEVSRQTGKQIAYNNLSEAEYKAALSNFLPEAMAAVVADAEAHAANGALDEKTHTLSELIGRPTTTLAEAVAAALKAPPAAH